MPAGVTDEKASATHALGLYAEFCGDALAPYYGTVLNALGVSVEYFHEGVRECGYGSLGHLCTAAHSAAMSGACMGLGGPTAHGNQGSPAKVSLFAHDFEGGWEACSKVATSSKRAGMFTKSCVHIARHIHR